MEFLDLRASTRGNPVKVDIPDEHVFKVAFPAKNGTGPTRYGFRARYGDRVYVSFTSRDKFEASQHPLEPGSPGA